MRLPATLLHILIAGQALIAGPALGQDPQIQRLGDELVNSRDMGMRRKAAQSLGPGEPKVAVRLAILRRPASNRLPALPGV
jgi:hypothetical protein